MNRVINEPHISVNKLGEYLVATPSRQRKILEILKYPKDEGGGWGHVHSEARLAIKRYFVNNLDESYIKRCIKSIRKKIGTRDEKKYHASSILLLECVLIL